jgi:predicted porin
MKKHIIALAITSAFVATSALADVEIGPFAIYGNMATAMENISVTAGPKAVLTSLTSNQNRLMDQTSSLGFKIKHDLGNGLTALGQIESRLLLGNTGSTSDDKGEIGSRNSFAGISSKDVGTIRLGRYDNAYKLSTKQQAPGIAGALNDASSDVGSKQILTRLGGRQGDLVAYESPNFGGLTVLASYNFGKDQANSISGGSTSNTAKNDISNVLAQQTSLAAGYANGPFALGIGYTTVSNVAWKLDASSAAKAAYTAGGTHALTAVQYGGSFTMAPFSVGAVFETTVSSLANNANAYDQQQNVYGVTLGYTADAFEVQLRLAQAGDVTGTGTGSAASVKTLTAATQMGVAVQYTLNKFAKVIGSYTSLENGANAGYIAGSEFALGTGSSQSTAALGLKVSF